jgi:probable phosphoglycerate mutase
VELLLVRHGLPVRLEREDEEPADPPLSAHGRDQAERLVRWLESESVHALYTSPMRRARETAEPMARARDLELRVEPDLVELDHLSSTYVPMEELKATDYEAWLAAVRGGLYAHIDMDAFLRRVADSLERIARTHRGQRVVVFCHGGVINTWTAHVLGLAPTLFFDPVYTSVSRFLVASSGEQSLVSLNETAHLR